MDQISGRRFLVDKGVAPAFMSLAEAFLGRLAYLSSAGEKPGGAEAVRPKFQMDYSSNRGPDGHLRDDFLLAHKMSVDPAAGKLVQDSTGLSLSTPSHLPVG
jgi:hypothetical protein